MTVPLDTVNDIRSMDAAGRSRSEIARVLHVSRNTVAKYADMEDMSPAAPMPQRRGRPALEGNEEWVIGVLEADLGPRGSTGKTHLSCALAKAACAKRIRTCYIRQPDLEDLWRESRDRPGGERKLLRKYGAFGLLVIDEWLLERPDELFRGMLLELFELRYGRASTVLCTQFRKKDWHPRLGGGVHADAIMDRIVHNAVWVEMGDMNMRQAMAGKGR